MKRESEARCTYDGCTNVENAAGLCATHRRRKRLGLPMSKPIRKSVTKVTFDHALAEALALPEQPHPRDLRRVRVLFRRWALCR